MSVQTLYVPHTARTVLGSHHRLPWVADSAERAVAAAWQGQPVFADRAQAFTWIGHARTGQAISGWLRRSLAEHHQSIGGEWLLATGHRPDPRTPAPARAHHPAAPTQSTVDGLVALPLAPTAAPVAALPAGRAR